uniref:Ferritin n=1 Tax=Ignisphaera aggregans TaxID=334771 RepID=A0A7C5YWE5_9CREN
MLDKKVEEVLNKQLNQELQNAYLYLSMASYFMSLNLSGFAHYFLVQAKEEVEHAMKIFRYISDRGGKVELYEIPRPRSNWSSIEEAIEDFYNSEVANSKRIWELVEVVNKIGDKATESFLKWFVDEQVEEERNSQELLTKIKMVKESPPALLMLDNILGQRK